MSGRPNGTTGVNYQYQTRRNNNTTINAEIKESLNKMCLPLVLHVLFTMMAVILTIRTKNEYKVAILTQHVVSGVILGVVLHYLCIYKRSNLAYILILSPFIVTVVQFVILFLSKNYNNKDNKNSNKDEEDK